MDNGASHYFLGEVVNAANVVIALPVGLSAMASPALYGFFDKLRNRR